MFDALKKRSSFDLKGWTRALGFTATAFLSAFLLFLVQPMAAKRLLPSFGGTPAVWTVSMLFFQIVLLAGYFYAHLLTTRAALGAQVVLHLALFGVGLCGLGVGDDLASDPDLSTDWTTAAALLRSLALNVGVPFLMLASTAPILQSWFAAPRGKATRDPYFLYVASNLGSLAALLLYPAVVERWLALDDQFHRWRLGVALVGVGIAVCGGVVLLGARGSIESPLAASVARVDRSAWAGWVVLAFIPSSLLLGVTTYITTDLSSIPLLWVIPLGLYLLTFIIAFSPWNPRAAAMANRVYPLILVLLALSLGFGIVKAFLLPLHVLGFFLGAMVCHGALAERRPDPLRLTSFYLAVSVGGCLGGVFNGLLAPWLFRSIAEYPMAMVLAAVVVALRSGTDSISRKQPATGPGIRPRALRTRLAARAGSTGPVATETTATNREFDPRLFLKPRRSDFIIPVVLGVLAALICGNVGGLAESSLGVLGTVLIAGFTILIVIRQKRQPLRFAMTVAALLGASHFSEAVNGRLLLAERSFFGVTQVTDVPEGPFHRMFHGSTLHGQQGLSPELRHVPLSYFSETGPIGDLFRARHASGPLGKVAVAGLGAGSLLTYAEASEDWTVYEIDPAIARIASDPRYFTYVNDCEAKSLSLVVGDARLEIAKQPPGEFSMIFLDAFSSDAIPMHLITREALAIYRQKCKNNGWLIFNISNRYLDLIPVVGLLAEDAAWACRVRIDTSISESEKRIGKRASIWAVMASTEAQLGAIGNDPRWLRPRRKPGDSVWTDGYSDILEHLRWQSVSTSP